MITDDDVRGKVTYIKHTPVSDDQENILEILEVTTEIPKFVSRPTFERCWSYKESREHKCRYVEEFGCWEWLVHTPPLVLNCGCDWTACSDLDAIINEAF